MSSLDLYSKIPSLAEATYSGMLSQEQREDIALIREDEVLNFEYEDYLDFIIQLRNYGERSRVRSIIANLKIENRTFLHKVRTVLEQNRTMLDYASRAAAFVLFGILLYFLVESKVDKSQKQIIALGKKVSQIDYKQKVSENEDVQSLNPANYSGTAFAINDNGLFLTAYHIVNGADSVYVYSGENKAFKAEVLASDAEKDIAILQIVDEFTISEKFPYSIRTSESNLSSDVFTLSFSKNDKVYNQGYVSSLTGFNGDTTFYQLYLPASEGASGSPVIDNNSNIIGFVSSKNSSESDVTYAVKMKYVQEIIDQNKEIENNTIFRLNSKSEKANLKKNIDNLNDFIVNVRAYKS